MATNPSICRVLVVDDEPLIRWALAETLGDRGYEVVEAGDARAALQAVADAADPFDVVVLDFRLPDSNDLTLLSRILQFDPAPQVIMMTAHGSQELTEKALRRGAYRVVNKPFEMAQVAALVSQAQTARPSP